MVDYITEVTFWGFTFETSELEWLWVLLLMERILHQVVSPVIYKNLYNPCGAGFLPSTVVRLRSRGAKSDLTSRDMNKKVCVLDILLPRNGVALAGGGLGKKTLPHLKISKAFRRLRSRSWETSELEFCVLFHHVFLTTKGASWFFLGKISAFILKKVALLLGVFENKLGPIPLSQSLRTEVHLHLHWNLICHGLCWIFVSFYF